MSADNRIREILDASSGLAALTLLFMTTTTPWKRERTSSSVSDKPASTMPVCHLLLTITLSIRQINYLLLMLLVFLRPLKHQTFWNS